MIAVRSLVFNLTFFAWTTLVTVFALPLLLAPRNAASDLGGWWSGTVLALAAKILRLDYEVRGTQYLPAGACIVAMKHQSTWDTLAIPVLLRRPAIVIKRELLWIPFYGWYLRRAGMLPVDRSGGASALKALIRQARAAISQGHPIAIFPEGTRTAVGARRPYLPGVSALYAQLGVPVVPAAVNSGLFWGRRAFLKRPGRIVVEFLPPIEPGLDRRLFAAFLEARIEAATAHLVAETRTRGIG